MAITLSAAADTARKNGAIDAISALLDGGDCLIQTTGGASTLVTISLNADSFAAASGGSAAINTAGGLSALATAAGDAAQFQLRSSGAVVHVTGTVATTGGDMTISGPNGATLAINDNVTITAYTLTQP